MNKIVISEKERFGRLTTTSSVRTYKGTRSEVFWECVCDCGKTKNVRPYDLKRGKVISCGCYNLEKAKLCNFKHGLRHTKEYMAHCHIRTRCKAKTGKFYRNYVLRGVKVCERWAGSEGFMNFLADMGKAPSSAHSIDRIDNNGNYEPGNCRWATNREQCNNRRHHRLVTWEGETKTTGQWATYFGASYSKIRSMRDRGKIEQGFKALQNDLLQKV